MHTTKATRKKAVSKNLRASFSGGERAKGSKKAKVRRDKYRSFSVTEKENAAMPGLAKKAGFDDVASWLRFVAFGTRD